MLKILTGKKNKNQSSAKHNARNIYGPKKSSAKHNTAKRKKEKKFGKNVCLLKQGIGRRNGRRRGHGQILHTLSIHCIPSLMCNNNHYVR